MKSNEKLWKATGVAIPVGSTWKTRWHLTELEVGPVFAATRKAALNALHDEVRVYNEKKCHYACDEKYLASYTMCNTQTCKWKTTIV